MINKIKFFHIILIAAGIVWINANVQAAPKKEAKPPEQPKVEKVDKVDSVSLWTFQTNDDVSISVAGGYFTPMGVIDEVLDPTWLVRLSVQNNQMNDTRMGMGLDFIYTYPPDKEYDAGLMFFSLIPSVTATFPLFNMFDVQIKPGVGISFIESRIRGTNSYSADLTMQFGVGVQRLLFSHLVVGIDGSYLYYFERSSFSAYTINFSLGYRI